MEGGPVKTVFFLLILCSLTLFTLFSTTTGDLWVQTDYADFDAGEKIRVDTITDPGNVTLSKVWTKLPTECVLDVGAPGAWDDEKAFSPTVLFDGVTYHMWYAGHNLPGSNTWIGHATSPNGYQWTKDPMNPVLQLGPGGSWDDFKLYYTSVRYTGSQFQMWYSGDDGNYIRIGYATSPDGSTWTKHPGNPVLDLGASGSFDDILAWHPSVIYEGLVYHMWYVGYGGENSRIGYATSSDGIVWNKYPGNPVMDVGPAGSWDDVHIQIPDVHYIGGTFHMWYSGQDGSATRIGHAISSDGINWSKDPENPVLDLGFSGTWDDEVVGHPRVLIDGSSYRMYYNGFDGSTWRIGYAESDDGLTWTKMPSVPVMDAGPPTSWDDEYVWTPSVVYEGGMYHMWYTGRDGAKNRIGYATSSDGISWSKYGGNPVLNLGSGGSWDDNELYTLSVIYNGSGFQMWYGGDDNPNVRIGYATSPDGMTWTKHPSNPVLNLNSSGSWDDMYIWYPSVIFDGSEYHMWYIGNDGSGNNAVGYATSTDGVLWNKYGSNPVFTNGSAGEWDSNSINSPNVYFDGKLYHMFYGGYDGSNTRIGHAISVDGISWTRDPANPVLDVGLSGSWDDTGIYSPSVLHDGTALKMWYTGNDGSTRRIGYAEFLYYQRGTLTSSVFNSGAAGTIWNSIKWTENLPSKTNITITTRTGDVPVPDGSWTVWSPEMWNENGLALTLPRSRYIQYRATLYSSNRYLTPTLSDITIDYSINTAQAPTLSLPFNNSITQGSIPTFQWVSNDSEGDSQDEFEVQIDDDPLFSSIDYSSGVVTSISEEWTPDVVISDGIWFWHVRTRDGYGLWSDWSESWKITIDTTPPEPFIPIANPDSWTNNSRPEITFSTTDSLSGINYYEVRIDGGSFSNQTSPYMLPSQNDGVHNITVRAFDLVGNYKDGYVEIYIDTTPPAAPGNMVSSPSGWTIVNSFTIDWINPTDASGIKSGARYKLGEPPSSNSDGTWILSKPIIITSMEGEHTLYLWLEDNVGNTNYLNYSTVNLFLDSIAPNITHTPLTKADPGKEITITATVTDNVAVKDVKLYFRKRGDVVYEILNMSNGGDVYTAIIPTSFVTTKGIEYYISASDEINTATYPSSGAIVGPFPIDIDEDPEPCFVSWFWLILLLAIILIILFLLLARRRYEEDVGIGTNGEEENHPEESGLPISEEIPEEKPQSETDLTEEELKPAEARGESGTTPKTVPPLTTPLMTDDEIFESIKKKYEEGKISQKTFEEIKERYKKK